MNAGGIERIVAVPDSQEAGAELKCLRSQAAHVSQAGSGSETAVAVPVRDDAAGQAGADA